MKSFHRLSLKAQFGILLAALIGLVIGAGSIIGRSIVVSQTLKESRSIAQMVEHIGKWGSQYGGIHVKTSGVKSPSPGSYLERYSYTFNAEDSALLGGSRVVSRSAELDALRRVESYHWKNPALIQREVSEIAAASASPAKFRITAKTVLNPNNAPNAFEREAIEHIDADFDNEADNKLREYAKVEGGTFLYARAMVAGSSCLRCHGSREAAPGFLKTNVQFNGGGGFGYQDGKLAGIISVSVPLPKSTEALADSLTSTGWTALGTILLAGLMILAFVVRNVIAPINRLRSVTDELASARLGHSFVVPKIAALAQDGPSNNEVHRLAHAIGRLGQSLKYVYGKFSETRQ
jgi:HAMP domain-containing protein